MKIIIDTHVALWLFNEYENLSSMAKTQLCNEENELFISIVSAWEVAIKHSLGKLPGFQGGAKRFLATIYDSPIEIIGVLPYHIGRVESLPFIHRDPFDRLLIATTICEDMTIMTADSNIQKYDVKYIW